MLSRPYYFSTIRKTVVAIGALFNNVHLVTSDAVGVKVKDTKVPLSYASRMAYWSKLREEQLNNGSASVRVQTTLPRMSFELTGMTYDASRQKNALGVKSFTSPSSTNKRLLQMNPVPYDLSFEIVLYVSNVEDGLQLIEQILPVFTPSYNISINTIPEMGITEDIQVELADISTEDNYEDGFDTNRIITWTLSLTAKAHLYQPTKDVATIKKGTTNFADGTPTMSSALSSMGVDVLPSNAVSTDTHTVPTTKVLAPNQIV